MPDAATSAPGSTSVRPARGSKQPGWASFLRRLERLAHGLVRLKFEGAPDLWASQTDLLKLQREIQAAITAAKMATRADKSKRDELEMLRIALRLSRRLGDALAWLMLGLDRRVIHSLGHGPPVPVSPEERHGDVGMQAIAAHLASTGLGFPVLHDVTDCLRVGDITFVKPGDDKSREYLTVEVKTRLLQSDPAEDGDSDEFKMDVTVISTQPFSEEQTEERIATTRSEPTDQVRPRRPDRREERQLRRMSAALARRNVVDNTVTDIPGEDPLVATTIDSEARSHWKELRKVIRTARQEGYASLVVDDAVMYVAYYSKAGVADEQIKDDRLIRDVSSSGLLSPNDGRGWDSLVLNQIPDMREGRDRWYLPFYLFSIPWNAISDLMMNRLIIMAVVNPGQVMRRLVAEGFEVRVPEGSRRPGETFMLVASTTAEDGHVYQSEIGGLSHTIFETVHEFISIDKVVEQARAMLKVAQDVTTPHLLDELRSKTGEQSNHRAESAPAPRL